MNLAEFGTWKEAKEKKHQGFKVKRDKWEMWQKSIFILLEGVAFPLLI